VDAHQPPSGLDGYFGMPIAVAAPPPTAAPALAPPLVAPAATMAPPPVAALAVPVATPLSAAPQVAAPAAAVPEATAYAPTAVPTYAPAPVTRIPMSYNAPAAVAPAVVHVPLAAAAAPGALVPEQPTNTRVDRTLEAPDKEFGAAVRLGAEDNSEDSTLLADLLLLVLERGCSDLHLTVGAPPTVRMHGHLEPFEDFPVLTPQVILKTLYAILTQKQRERFEEVLELDFAYSLPGKARFRVNMYRQRDSVGAAFRLIPYESSRLRPSAYRLRWRTSRCCRAASCS